MIRGIAQIEAFVEALFEFLHFKKQKSDC